MSYTYIYIFPNYLSYSVTQTSDIIRVSQVPRSDLRHLHVSDRRIRLENNDCALSVSMQAIIYYAHLHVCQLQKAICMLRLCCGTTKNNLKKRREREGRGGTETEGGRERERESQPASQPDRERERDRQTDRQTGRQTDSARERQRQSNKTTQTNHCLTRQLQLQSPEQISCLPHFESLSTDDIFHLKSKSSRLDHQS